MFYTDADSMKLNSDEHSVFLSNYELSRQLIDSFLNNERKLAAKAKTQRDPIKDIESIFYVDISKLTNISAAEAYLKSFQNYADSALGSGVSSRLKHTYLEIVAVTGEAFVETIVSRVIRAVDDSRGSLSKWAAKNPTCKELFFLATVGYRILLDKGIRED